MLKISIDKYTLIGMMAIVFILLIAMILIFVAYMCHDKRKYESIDKFNEQSLNSFISYSDNLKKYNKNIEKSGVNYEKKSGLKVWKTIINVLNEMFK